MSVTTLEELAEALPAHITAARRVILDAARAVANEAGIVSARHAVTNALDAIERAQEALRVAQAAERDAKAAAADAAVEAEWELRDHRIAKEGNKTWWTTDDDELEPVLTEEDGDTAEMRATGRKLRVQVTADEARERLAVEVRRHHAVREAEQQQRAAEEATAAARDHLAQTERRFSAARADLNAAVAQLQVLALAIPREEQAR